MENFPNGPGLGTLLRHLIELLDGDVEEVYRHAGLDCRSRFTPVIRFIEREGPSSIRKIALASGLTHSAISQTVSEMLKKGLVISEPGEDARERIISFSPAGRALLPKLHNLWVAIGEGTQEISDEIGVPLREVAARAIAAATERPLRERILARLDEREGGAGTQAALDEAR